MNWKIWQWPGQIERFRRKAEYASQVVEARDEEIKFHLEEKRRLEAENDLLTDMLRLQQASPNAREVAAQLGEQLVVVTEATPWWRHLHGLLQLEIDQAVNDALMPDLTNDTANLRRGRAAMLKDFRGLLQSLWLQAQTRKRESA